jgi:glycosyltransferase involved in cell wall biosynthesis
MHDRIALIMPVRNEEDSVEATLDSVFQSTRRPDEYIIADGMSTDRTVERIRAHFSAHGETVTVVQNRKLWVGSGRNVAVEHASAPIILEADFGNLLHPNWIENMVCTLQNDRADIVAGMFRPFASSDYEHCVAAIHYFDEYVYDSSNLEMRDALQPEARVPGGLCVGFTRQIWERTGGFPEWLAKAQDKMFSRKAYALGAKVAIAWDAVVFHHMRRTPLELFKQMFSYGRGNGQSRYITPHCIKLAGFYGIVVVLLACSTLSAVFPASALAMLVCYAYRSGLAKVIDVDGGLKKVRFLWLSLLVLFPRDFGVLLGHAAGWLEWVFVPRYRQLFAAYTRDCPAERLHVVPR